MSYPVTVLIGNLDRLHHFKTISYRYYEACGSVPAVHPARVWFLRATGDNGRSDDGKGKSLSIALENGLCQSLRVCVRVWPPFQHRGSQGIQLLICHPAAKKKKKVRGHMTYACRERSMASILCMYVGC